MTLASGMMNHLPEARFPVHCRFPSTFTLTAAFLALLMAPARLFGDPVVAPPPERQAVATQSGSFDIPSRTSLFSFGPVALLPSISFSRIDSEGLLVQPGDSVEKTTITTIEPEFLVTLGQRWQLQYTPLWSNYSSDRFEDTVEHFVRFRGSAEFSEWRFSFSQLYESSFRTRVETGGQTNEDRWVTAFEAGVRLNRSVALDTNLDFSRRQSVGFQNSANFKITEWLNYQFSPRFTAAAGIGLGKVNPSSGVDTSELEFQARLQWKPSDRTTFSVNGGLSRRSFDDPGASDRSDPVYGASIQLRPFPATTVSVSTNRALRGSYFSNSITDRTRFDFNVTQRLLNRFQLRIGLVRQETAYIISTTGADAPRSDNLDAFSVSLTIPIRNRVSLAAFYRKSDNVSTLALYDFSNRQTGFSMALSF